MQIELGVLAVAALLGFVLSRLIPSFARFSRLTPHPPPLLSTELRSSSRPTLIFVPSSLRSPLRTVGEPSRRGKPSLLAVCRLTRPSSKSGNSSMDLEMEEVFELLSSATRRACSWASTRARETPKAWTDGDPASTRSTSCRRSIWERKRENFDRLQEDMLRRARRRQHRRWFLFHPRCPTIQRSGRRRSSCRRSSPSGNPSKLFAQRLPPLPPRPPLLFLPSLHLLRRSSLPPLPILDTLPTPFLQASKNELVEPPPLSLTSTPRLPCLPRRNGTTTFRSASSIDQHHRRSNFLSDAREEIVGPTASVEEPTLELASQAVSDQLETNDARA